MEPLVLKYYLTLLHKMEAILYPYKVAEKCHLLAYVLMILTLIFIIPTVRVIGIKQRKMFMSLNLFINRTFGLHPYKTFLSSTFTSTNRIRYQCQHP